MCAPAGLSPAQQAQFERDGALVIRDFFTAAEAATLRDRAVALTNEFDLSTHPKTVFTTKTDDQVASRRTTMRSTLLL